MTRKTEELNRGNLSNERPIMSIEELHLFSGLGSLEKITVILKNELQLPEKLSDEYQYASLQDVLKHFEEDELDELVRDFLDRMPATPENAQLLIEAFYKNEKARQWAIYDKLLDDFEEYLTFDEITHLKNYLAESYHDSQAQKKKQIIPREIRRYNAHRRKHAPYYLDQKPLPTCYYCSNQSYSLTESKFCPRCGSPLYDVNEKLRNQYGEWKVEGDDTLICSACNNPRVNFFKYNPDEFEYCQACGAEMKNAELFE